jgi:hypothetical protein
MNVYTSSYRKHDLCKLATSLSWAVLMANIVRRHCITLLLTTRFNCLRYELAGSALNLEKRLSEIKLLLLSLYSLFVNTSITVFFLYQL